MLTTVTLLFLICLVVATALFRPPALCHLYAFFITFQTVTIDVGLQITPDRMVALGMLAWVILKPRNFKIAAPMAFFIGYAIAATVLMALFIPDYADQFPLMRGRLRWVFQIVYLLLSFVPVVFITRHISTIPALTKFVNVFLASCTLQALLGLAQFFVHRLSSIDLFPLDLYNPVRSDANIAEFTFDRLNIFRVCALGGEPKHLAYSLIIALIFTFAKIYLLGTRMRELAAILLFSSVLVLTWSTQGLILFGLILFLVPLCISLIKKRLHLKSTAISLGFVLLALIGLSRTNYGAMVIFRTLDRISGQSTLGGGGIEDFDHIILSYLQDNPMMAVLGTGLGNVHFHSRPYIPKELLYFTENSVYVSKKGSIRLVSELGFIGLGMYLTMFLLPVINIRRFARRSPHSRFGHSLAASVLAVLSVYFLASDGPPYSLFALAVLLSLLFTFKRGQGHVA